MLPAVVTSGLDNIDTLAITITIVGYIVVFAALAILVFVFVRIKRIQDFFVLKKWKRNKPERAETDLIKETSGDENAAICTALYLYFSEMHDEEKYVMTIKKVSRNYSPWSSKIYNTQNVFKR
jgi:Na+-transporting methylmalonyl-CoA/oxaloacetate decarboxylase gamma subunit